MSADSQSQLILYQASDGQTRIQCRFENETVWLTQKLMAELFQKDVRTINEHIQNVFAEGELSPESVIRKFRITAADGKTYETQHYNLDVIISVGYRVKSPRGTLQNKLHFAATGRTAAELIAERADASRPNMGLTSWHGGLVRKGDVTVAKNYLRENEIEELNRLVVMFLDFAEDQARRRKQIFLQNWLTRLHDFLNLNERAILPDSGKVSREAAHQRAEDEYERFAARRRAELEARGEADLLNLLDAEVKQLPKRKRGGMK